LDGVTGAPRRISREKFAGEICGSMVRIKSVDTLRDDAQEWNRLEPERKIRDDDDAKPNKASLFTPSITTTTTTSKQEG